MMARELNVQTEDWQALLKQHSLMELLNPLAQEKLKVIILERKLLEAEARQQQAPVAPVNGELTDAEINREMSKAWEK
jgi:hypothetical protein